MRKRVVRLRSRRRDLEEELAFHFRETVEALMAAGLTRAEAEREARGRFGNELEYRGRIAAIDRSAERRRALRGWLVSAVDVVREAFRSVVRSPGLSLGVVLAFCLGIGANATMYGTVDRLLLRAPDGIADADRVVRLYHERWVSFLATRAMQSSFTYPDLMDLREIPGFAGVALYRPSSQFTVGRGLDARQLGGILASGNYWSVLGVRPQLGRFFTPEEDVRGGTAVAVISDAFWRRAYGASPDVLGATIDIGHGPYEVIGVAPPGFTGADLADVDLWLPLHVAAYALQGDEWERNRQWWWLRGVARYAEGAEPERVTEAASAVFANSRRLVTPPGEDEQARIIPASLIAARGPTPIPEAQVAGWLAAVSVLVLLIACANVANLLLARTVRQRRETGIRLALGVSRARLVGRTMMEGLLLALLGALGALAVTGWGGRLLQRTLLPDISWGPALTGRVLTFVALVTVIAGVVSALVPAIHAARDRVGDTLRESSGGITRSTSRTRAGLTLVQASLSVVLLVGAGLFVRSLNRVQSLDLGMDPRGVVIVSPVFEGGLPGREERLDYFGRAMARVASIPGVQAVGSAQTLPFGGSMAVALDAQGLDSVPTLTSGGPYVYPVSPGFFDALGLRLLRGRLLGAGDRLGEPQVAVVNQSMANTLWPAQDALDKCLYIREGGARPDACTRIVGIVADVRRQSIEEQAQLLYWVPDAQGITGDGPVNLVVRLGPTDAGPVVRALQDALLGLDSRVRYVSARALQDLIDPQLRSWKLGAAMFSVFGLLALVVAAIGLYSVLSFEVAQRRREIGLRGALGAGRKRIVRLFVARALRVTLAGTVLGALAAYLLAPRVESLLFQTPARDPATFLTVAAALLTVALLASALPAWRATGVAANEALRAD